MFQSTILSAIVALGLTVPVLAQEPAPADPALAPTAAAPQVSQAAQEILKNVPKLLDQQWKTTMLFDVKNGEEGTANVKAALMYQDFRHFSANLDIKAVEGEETQEMGVKILCDGEFLYLDGNLPPEQTGGLPLPIKVNIAVIEEMIKQSAVAESADAEGGDKEAAKQMVSEGLKSVFGMATVTEEGSTETMRRYVMTAEGATGWMTFGRDFWMPTGALVNGEDGMTLKMNSEGTAKVESFPEGTFVFQVAEGKSVMDLTPMLQGMLGPVGPAGGDDLEF